MIDNTCDIGGSKRATRRAYGLVLSLAALICVAPTARAAEVKIPKDRPEVALDVPNGWSVKTTAAGVEIVSPEKNSILVAQVVVRKKPIIEAWTKKAAADLEAFGVSFDQNIKAANKTAGAAPAPSVAPVAPHTGATSPGTFTFSGAPSLGTPGTSGFVGADNSAQAAMQPMDSFDSRIRRTSKLQFKTVEYPGTTLKGHSVDTELAIYPLSDTRVLLVMQESESSDNRSVVIARSAHAVN